jgi:hypothetical protein
MHVCIHFLSLYVHARLCISHSCFIGCSEYTRTNIVRGSWLCGISQLTCNLICHSVWLYCLLCCCLYQPGVPQGRLRTVYASPITRISVTSFVTLFVILLVILFLIVSLFCCLYQPEFPTGVLPEPERKTISFEGKVYVAPLTTVGE